MSALLINSQQARPLQSWHPHGKAAPCLINTNRTEAGLQTSSWGWQRSCACRMQAGTKITISEHNTWQISIFVPLLNFTFKWKTWSGEIQVTNTSFTANEHRQQSRLVTDIYIKKKNDTHHFQNIFCSYLQVFWQNNDVTVKSATSKMALFHHFQCHGHLDLWPPLSFQGWYWQRQKYSPPENITFAIVNTSQARSPLP